MGVSTLVTCDGCNNAAMPDAAKSWLRITARCSAGHSRDFANPQPQAGGPPVVIFEGPGLSRGNARLDFCGVPCLVKWLTPRIVGSQGEAIP